jgi:hypothetical protein
MSTIETSLIQDKEERNQITDTIENRSGTRANDAKRQMNVKKVVTQIRFLLCSSCFWCASYIGLQSNMHTKILTQCVICKKGKIQSLPV